MLLGSGTGVAGGRDHAATAADEQVGINGALAAALTRAVGSMPALYVVLVIVGGWMALATWGPLRAADAYPFRFLLFLDNVVQLMLCLVILVGQRVLGAAADRRAVQTYEDAEVIFTQIAGLHRHLDRHDRALSRGVGLLESSPHPWVRRHRVQQPPRALDQAVTLNGRIAAWLTERLGSMWAFYAAAATQVIWIVLGTTGVQRFDRYPFEFMTLLSTLAQLVFMMVIMVGQDVLGRTADRRSEQTFLDAEAIVHEVGRMKVRFRTQDRIIDSLVEYSTTRVAERLAQVLYDRDAHAGLDRGAQPGGMAAPRAWEELPEELKAPARAWALQLGEQLTAVGCALVPTVDPASDVVFDDEEAAVLARLEHERWVREHGPRGDIGGGTHSDMVAWEELSEQARARRVRAARELPALLAGAGFQVLRHSHDSPGPGEHDFLPEDWVALQQALMAAGVLVALAEGVVDAEEMFMLVKTLRQASVAHPRRFIRELTAASNFNTGLQPGMRYADYEPLALAAIRDATAIVATTTPGELAGFRAFLVEIAEVVGDANLEGGFLGIGARRRVPAEAAAIEAVRKATEGDDEQPT